MDGSVKKLAYRIRQLKLQLVGFSLFSFSNFTLGFSRVSYLNKVKIIQYGF